MNPGANMDSSVKCGNCRFFYSGTSSCRKRAPNHAGFPTTYEEKWCGEFKRKFIHEEDNRNLEPQKLVKRQCGNCIHFRTQKDISIKEAKSGYCTYNPPSLFIYNSGASSATSHTEFPSVKKGSCCSKFRAREIVIEEPQNVLTQGKRAITFGDS